MSFINLKGKVKTGKKVGRKIGFPTINIDVPRAVKNGQWGIYFSLVKVDGRIYPGVTHLGPPKTFHLIRPTCETHLLTFHQDLYDQAVEIKLILKFREVEHYPTINALKKQLRQDVKNARKFFGL